MQSVRGSVVRSHYSSRRNVVKILEYKKGDVGRSLKYDCQVLLDTLHITLRLAEYFPWSQMAWIMMMSDHSR